VVSQHLTERPPERARLGRASAKLHEELRRAISSGEFSESGYVPTQRDLSARFDLAHTTVRRALKRLEAEGLIASEPRRGFRILAKANDPTRGCPLAYIPELSSPAFMDGPFHGSLLVALREAAARRGWSLLTSGDGAAGQTLAGLRAQRAFGVVLNTVEPGMLRAVVAAGLPAVVVNDQPEGFALDSVIQDGQEGGLLAARYLGERGCRRVAWLGSSGGDVHSLDRLGGALAGIQRYCGRVRPELVCEAPQTEWRARSRELLARADRPDGIICLWREAAMAVSDAAADAGLVLGRDLHLVGWCPEEVYDRDWVGALRGRPVPPAIVWRVGDMAELALARLAERRESPGLPELRVRIPVRLRLPDGA
jgi:LacI family transcriptional regulator